MRFTRVDHIGIAVEDFDAAVVRYTKLHGMAPMQVVDLPAEGVRVAFFPVGETQIELLGVLGPESPLATFLVKRGPGLHHICYVVTDVDQVTEDLHREGFTSIPRPGGYGARGARVAFFHPKSTGGVLIELVAESTRILPK